MYVNCELRLMFIFIHTVLFFLETLSSYSCTFIASAQQQAHGVVKRAVEAQSGLFLSASQFDHWLTSEVKVHFYINVLHFDAHSIMQKVPF
jgi:hypothetical protein